MRTTERTFEVYQLGHDGSELSGEYSTYYDARRSALGWVQAYRDNGYAVRGIGPNQWLAERDGDYVNIDIL